MPEFFRRNPSFPRRRFFAAALALALATPPAFAQTAAPPEGDSWLKQLFKAGNLATDPPAPKDFVTRTRPAEENYVPLHVRPADRPLKVLTPVEAEKRRSELDALRVQHDKLSGRAPAPISVAATPASGKKPGRRKPAS